MALYDNLPLNTPTKVADDGVDLEVWATRTSNPPVGGSGTVEYRYKPAGPTATTNTNRDALNANVAAALARLRTIQTQATTFQGQAAYGTANLTNLNDLLAKCQTIAGAVHDIAQDLVAVARIMSAQYDGTT